MKFKSSHKRILLSLVLVLVVMGLSGCRIPTDETGAIKEITLSTTFQETMANENWFNALLVYPMAQFLNRFTPKVTLVGALVILTIVVNVFLVALTLKSTIASQRMQLIQPELNKISRKYEGRTDEQSRQKQAMEMQRLYQKYDVNPLSAIGSQFLQFPFIIAMFQAVQRAYAVKHGEFFGASLSVTPLNGIMSGNMVYLVIFLVMCLTQFVSMSLPKYLAKRKAQKEAEKQHRRYQEPERGQNEYMQFGMLAMIAVFGLMWPAAMSIYWSINSLVAIAKTFIVQKIVEKQEGAHA